ncbi:sensor histidine kinase [Pseudahrensia aquimaris]|uniref:histidine kinase n=1 Tax=Pseudahrensia aquimaris TaxID=744461 RepID=A0ABW3FDJ8_9HYPH
MSAPQQKWRPALWMVVFGVLMLVALLPLVGLALIIAFESWFDVQFRLRSAAGLLGLAAGSLTMAAIVGAVFVRTLVGPTQELIERTSEIDKGADDAYRPLTHNGTRETATLAQRFFTLAQRLSDRSNYLTLFTTHLSHEFKTPLTSIIGAAELMKDSAMKKSERERFLTNIITDATRLNTLSSRLRDLARADAVQAGEPCNLLTVLQQAAREAEIELESDGVGEPTIAISQENALIVFRQLTDNAAQSGASMFKVSAREGSLLIGDDGSPIPDDARANLFDQFFTTKQALGGTGMGLGIARTMLKNHGADLRLSDVQGWKFEMRLPL